MTFLQILMSRKLLIAVYLHPGNGGYPSGYPSPDMAVKEESTYFIRLKRLELPRALMTLSKA